MTTDSGTALWYPNPARICSTGMSDGTAMDIDATSQLAFEIARVADGVDRADVNRSVDAVMGNWFGPEHSLDEVSARVIDSLAD